MLTHTAPLKKFTPRICGKSNLVQEEAQRVTATRFPDNRHLKVVWLSALRTGRLYTTGNILVFISVTEAESTPGPKYSRKDQAGITGPSQ